MTNNELLMIFWNFSLNPAECPQAHGSFESCRDAAQFFARICMLPEKRHRKLCRFELSQCLIHDAQALSFCEHTKTFFPRPIKWHTTFAIVKDLPVQPLLVEILEWHR